MNRHVVSILVAVYNAESYLPRCLDSLRAQTLRDIQIICVDDCSTDGSLQLLHDYARQDSRIEVYQMARNGGQAKARNEALRHACCDYVAFLDSDDWLAPDALEECVKTFEQYPHTDCVIMRVLYVDEQGRQEDYAKPIPQVMSGKEAFLASLDWSVHGWYVTRSSFYERWPYDDTCMSYSDDNTTRLHYYHSREVRFAQQARYYYFVYSQSVTQKATPRRFDYLRAVESMKNHLVALGVERKVMAFYESQRMQVLVGCYMFYHVHGHELSEEDRRFGLSELRHAWESIDRTLLNDEATAKFGYRPCRYWFLFRMQEWLYFTLRGFLGKNR